MKYKTIICDYPWKYRNQNTKALNGTAEAHYPTMPTKQGCQLPVGDIADPDCILLMWGTWPLLADAMQIIDSWGFKQTTGFPMIKIKEVLVTAAGDPLIVPTYGTGFWVRGCSEYVLICRRKDKRGRPKNHTKNFVGILSSEAVHSRKPQNLHEFGSALEGPRLELFARRPTPGWEIWGNQVNSVKLPGFPEFVDAGGAVGLRWGNG